ncbi:unnamed protein product, partial [Tenebrio molitor]
SGKRCLGCRKIINRKREIACEAVYVFQDFTIRNLRFKQNKVLFQRKYNEKFNAPSSCYRRLVL